MPENETLKELIERTIKESIDSKFDDIKKNKEGIYSSSSNSKKEKIKPYKQQVTNNSSIAGKVLGSAISYGLFWNPLTNYLDRKYQIGQKIGNNVVSGFSNVSNIWRSLKNKKQGSNNNIIDEDYKSKKIQDSFNLKNDKAKAIINTKSTSIKVNNAIMMLNNINNKSKLDNQINGQVLNTLSNKNTSTIDIIKNISNKLNPLKNLDKISKSMTHLVGKILPSILNKNTLIVGGIILATALLGKIISKFNKSMDKSPYNDFSNKNIIPDQKMNVEQFSNSNVASLINKKTKEQFNNKSLQNKYNSIADGLKVTSDFGQRSVLNGSRNHRGIDIGHVGGYQNIANAPIYAPFRFVVSNVEYQGRKQNGDYGSGNKITLDRVTKFQPNLFYNPDKKVQIIYMHLSQITIKKGQQGGRGTVIGSVGHSGGGDNKNNKMLDHLHVELIVDGSAINPNSKEGKKYIAGELYGANKEGQSYLDFYSSTLRGQDIEQLKTIDNINKNSNGFINNITSSNIESQLNKLSDDKITNLVGNNNDSPLLAATKIQAMKFNRLSGPRKFTSLINPVSMLTDMANDYGKISAIKKYEESNRNEITSQQNSNKINQTQQDLQRQKTKENLRASIINSNSNKNKSSVTPIITGPSKMDQIQQATVKVR